MHDKEVLHAFTPSSGRVFADEASESLYRHWIEEFPLVPIKNDNTYDLAIKVFEVLGDRINSGKAKQSEIDYYEILSDLLERFEEAEYPSPDPMKPSELLRYLMEVNGLKQEDLVDEFGTQSRISEFLNNKRDLTLRQIKNLSKRFSLSPEAFMS